MTAPFRVGVLNDMSDGPPGPGRNVEQWLRLAVDDVAAQGRIDREVEFVPGGSGFPRGRPPPSSGLSAPWPLRTSS